MLFSSFSIAKKSPFSYPFWLPKGGPGAKFGSLLDIIFHVCFQ
jgi:hypothetical protein